MAGRFTTRPRVAVRGRRHAGDRGDYAAHAVGPRGRPSEDPTRWTGLHAPRRRGARPALDGDGQAPHPWETTVLRANGIALVVTKTGNLTPECRAAYKRINLHLHDLRREAGSRWLDAGIPLHQVQAWLGHTNISQTSAYLAVPEGDGFALMERFERRRAEMLQETCKLEGESWSGREDSNLRPLGPEPSALPG